jgi:hypothetical protein
MEYEWFHHVVAYSAAIVLLSITAAIWVAIYFEFREEKKEK